MISRKLLLLLLLLVNIQVFAQVPVINSFSPASGPVATAVTITGTGYNVTPGNNMVFFGGVKATIISATATTLKTSVPAGSQNLPITVINLGTGLQVNSARPFYTTFVENGTNVFKKESFSSASFHDDNGGFRVWLNLADVDNDGKTDLVIVNSYNQTINIYRNTAVSGTLNAASLTLAATFNVTPDYLAYNPQAVKLADLDGDGKLDIIVPYLDQGKVGIYKNNTTPGVISRTSFGNEIQLNVGSSVTWVSIADLDNNGKPEIITANHTAGTISILKNIGTKGNLSSSSFAVNQDISVGQLGSAPNSVETGDIDGDGKADVLVGNIYGFYILRNTSTSGVFSFTGTQTTINGSACNAYLTDMDGDGKYDVVLNAYEQHDVYVFRNTTATAGAIGFAPAVVLTTSAPIAYLQFGDLNGDTHPEIITTPYGGNCTVFRNLNKSGSITTAAFGTEIDLGFGSPDWSSTAVGDIDGDGKPDVVTEDGYSTVTLLHNNIAGLPQITGFTPTSAGPGETVTITGKNFSGANKVTFGSKPATTIAVQSATSITAVLDRGTTGYIAVTNNEGRDSIPGFTYNGPPPPVITSFTPKSGDIGDVIYITGTNFISSQPIIKIGGVYPRLIQSESATSITVVIDTGATGAITVSNIDGTASLNGFTFTPKPQIFSLDNSGAKGETVTIKGKYLGGTSSVTLGGVPVASFTVVSPGMVKFVVGDGETGDLVLKTKYGQAVAGFFYKVAPVTLNSATPMAAPAGATIQITGANFSVLPQNNFVFFGTVHGVVTKATPTTLYVTVPYGALYAPVSVTVRGYTRSTSKPFVLTFAGGGIINTTTFGARMDMFAGNYVNELSVTDIDNDGLPDLILTDWGDSNIGTRKNQSKKGVFKFQYDDVRLSYYGSDEGGPVDGVVIDLNNDGFMDYETKTDYGYLPQLINSNGSYFFESAYGTGYGYGYGKNTNMVVGDMNGSGQPVVMLNGPVSGKAYVADIDGDNKPDFIVGTANSVSIFRNTTPAGARDATYAPVVTLALNALAKNLAIGDFDGDGKADIIALSMAPYTTAGALVAYRNKSTVGNIAFSQDLTIPVEQDAYLGSSCTVGDVDGDGKVELIYSSKGKTSVFKNTGTVGTIAFAPKVDYIADGSVSLTVADFDGDGQPDIAGLGNSGRYHVFILRNLTGTLPVTDIKPAYGPIGTTITISGSGFAAAKSVSLGGYNLKNFTVVSPTTITAVVDSTVSGYVSITTTGNTATSLTKYFTADAPIITPADTVAIFAGDSVKLSSANKPGFYTDVSYDGPTSGYFLSQYQWSKDGADISDVTASYYTAHQPGVYILYLPLISSGRIASKPVVVKVIDKLPANNFLVSVTNASCKGSSTGAINIKARYTVNYTAVVSGSGYNFTYPFTGQLAVNNLPAGKYNLCITVDAHPAMQQCLTLVITEPKDISLYSVVSNDSKNVTLAMSGGNTYNIQLNGVLHTTTDSTITLPLTAGRNSLLVTTDKPCQGVIDKTITAADQVLLYPNPVDNTLYIALGNQPVLKVTVEIYSAMGRIVYKRLFNNPGNTLQLDVSSIGATGTYVLKLMTDNSPQKVLSIIKR